MLRAGEVSSRELTELYLERIERIDPALNSYRDRLGRARPGRGRRRGRERSRPGRRRRCSGCPIAIKDTLDVEGDVTTLGTAGYDRPGDEDSSPGRRGSARRGR